MARRMLERSSIRVFLLACIAVAMLAGAPAVPGQTLPGLPAAGSESGEQGETGEQPGTAAALAGRLDSIQAELEANRRDLEAAAEGSLDRIQLSEESARLREIEDLLLAQQEIVEGVAPEPLEVREAAAFDRPASAVALGGLLDHERSLANAVERLVGQLEAAREALKDARESLSASESARRQARQLLDEAADPAARDGARRALRLRELDSRVAERTVELQTLRVRRAEAALEAAKAQRARLSERIDRMRVELRSGSGDAEAIAEALGRREVELRRFKEAIARELAPVELRLAAAERRFAARSDPGSALLREVEVLTLERDALRKRASIVEGRLERIDEERRLWHRWDAVLRGRAAHDEIDAWASAAREVQAALRRAQMQSEERIEDLGERLDRAGQDLAQLEPGDTARALLEEKRSALTELIAAHRADVRERADMARLAGRLVGDLEAAAGDLDPLEMLARAWRSVRDAWTTEITSVDDSPITVGSLVQALFLAALGFVVARRGSAALERFTIERLRLDPGAAHALQTLSFYLLLVAFTLFALRSVHFPLTAFTVLGGALAIGVGFGSQNVMNNFISGLILMLERPVRVRDLVEVDGNFGTIENIGARSTQIRSTDGRHIVVPNSFFLESNVVNWTLSDDLIRAHVGVGVAYGSPTDRVAELIRRAVDENPEVLRQPEPIVLFQEFGDNSLGFAVYYWVRARGPMAVQKLESAVRFRIDQLFREHGIVIAFPQRDVHLDSLSPIDVRVVHEGDGPARIAPGRPDGEAGD